jgi:hypothetical protein
MTTTGLGLSQLLTVARFRDRNGRPMLEPLARAEAGHVPDYKTCPYPGIRKGRLMNVSALKMMGAHWKEILGGFGFLAREHRARHPGRPALEEAWQVTQSAIHLPLYLFMRAEAPVADGDLPCSISGMFKASLDIATTAFAMIVSDGRSSDDGDLPAAIDVAAEAGAHYLNGALYACAGAPNQIAAVLRMISDASLPPEAEEVSALVPDLEGFFRLAHIWTCAEVLLFTLRMEGTRALLPVFEAWSPTAEQAELHATLTTYLHEPSPLTRVTSELARLFPGDEAHDRLLGRLAGLAQGIP